MHQEQRDRDSDDALGWLSAVLWPDGGTEIRAGGSGSRTWWASPSATTPHILIPANAPAAARRAVRRYHDGFDRSRRAKSLLAEATMSIPGLSAQLLRGSRVGQGPDATDGVLDGLAELLDQPDLVVAISLSVPKSNRKPVLQLLTPSGHCLGWAKVGWSPISERLVANEATWLDRRAANPIPLGRDGSELVIPQLLNDEVVAGRRVVITSGVEVARRPGDRPDALPPLDVFGAVAARGTVDTVALAESTWWQSVQDALSGADAAERVAVEAAADAAAGHRFDVGAWHGDLTPWNLMTVGRRIQLIDWELAADGVPIGFDLCHFHTQVGAEMKGLSGADALNRSARLSPQGLTGLGIDARNHTILWRLYLVELVRRMLVLRADGYPTEQLDHGPAALARLS
ncbi:MAG: hypothetical protein AAFO29_21450, partial [Actinomycetota bacterium]